MESLDKICTDDGIIRVSGMMDEAADVSGFIIFTVPFILIMDMLTGWPLPSRKVLRHWD
jgi:hypothetical protein